MTQLAQAIDTVTTYLAAMERRDLDAAQALVVPEGLELVFPGNRRFSDLSAVVANSSGRYQRIGKRITGRDAWESDGRVRVMITGTLYGQWHDGTAFEDIRFVDWFELESGQIARQRVWNDTGEAIISALKRAEA
jgi:hypothetical protein